MSAAHLISTDQLLGWASEKSSEGDLPWLIRNLILLEVGTHSRIEFDTGRGVGNSGFDGTVETGTASTQVPKGFSIWEVSTRADVKAKANEDFLKRSSGDSETNRLETTYIGVSLRRFQDRRRWENEKRAEGIWKDVKFFDVEDLSLWLDRHRPRFEVCPSGGKTGQHSAIQRLHMIGCCRVETKLLRQFRVKSKRRNAPLYCVSQIS
jgi:hypothetical protein